jgi:hypothetical protein
MCTDLEQFRAELISATFAYVDAEYDMRMALESADLFKAAKIKMDAAEFKLDYARARFLNHRLQHRCS